MTARTRPVLLLVTGIGGDDSNFAGAIYPSLLRQARQLVGEQLAEDLVQDGYVAWYCRPRERRGAAQMRAWIGKAMRNLAINRATRVRDVLDQAASIEDTPWLV